MILFKIDESKLNLNDSASTQTNANTNTGQTKKISRILYEIGSILSFVGLGKDFKQNANNNQQNNQTVIQQLPQQQQQQTIQNLNLIPTSQIQAPLTPSSNSYILSPSFTGTSASLVTGSNTQILTRRSQDKKLTPSSSISSNNFITINNDTASVNDTHSLYNVNTGKKI